MNLIVNRHLDRSQEQAIYELTLKKQRSKKSTISQKQMEAMQQLANELVPQRKAIADQLVSSLDLTTPNKTNNSHEHNDLCRCDSINLSTAPQSKQTPTAANKQNHHHHHHHHHHDNSLELQRQSSTSTIATTSTTTMSSCSTSSAATTCSSQTSDSSLNDETLIKLNQLRLERLNAELKRRLNQYEYLVAQEKAILGAYNLALFTNEGVNNFHLYPHNMNNNNNNNNNNSSSPLAPAASLTTLASKSKWP